MSQCQFCLDHDRFGPVRCAAPAVDQSDRCVQHERRRSRPAPAEPDGEALIITIDGCRVWESLASYHQARRGKRAAELFSAASRPVAWDAAHDLWVDLVSWTFLHERGRARPAGTFQRCGRAGCIEPAHAVEPSIKRRSAAPVDVRSPLDRRFGLGAA